MYRNISNLRHGNESRSICMQLYVYATRQRMYVYIKLIHNNLANVRGTLRKVCGTTFPKSEKTETLGVKLRRQVSSTFRYHYGGG